MGNHKITRRKFVTGTGVTTLGATILPRHVLGGPGWQSPSDQLNIAMVGAGGRGTSDAAELVKGGENIVALADIDFDFVESSVTRRLKDREGNPNPTFFKLQSAYAKAKHYSDFRRMLERQKDIDAVVIATPDHTHAVVAKAAMELGKHVYVEKPLTYSVQEARLLRKIAQQTGVVTQMGNQGHSSKEARRINEWIQAGVIGAVRDVYVWTNRPIWPQGVPRPTNNLQLADGVSPGRRWSGRRVSNQLAKAMAGNYVPPSNLDWDLFLGPAPTVEYHPMYHPFNWRGWVDWGTSALGDMGAHLLDHPYWALGLTYPTSVETTSTPFGLDAEGKPASHPLATQAIYKFPARGDQPPVTLTWNDGGLMPPRPEVLPEDIPMQRGGGCIFLGEKGILMHETYGEEPQIFPVNLREAAEKVPKSYARIPTDKEGKALHHMNWALAAKGQGKSTSPFEYATRLTEVMLLGIAALRTGQGVKIHYDGKTGHVTSPSEANQYLHREARKGWSL